MLKSFKNMAMTMRRNGKEQKNLLILNGQSITVMRHFLNAPSMSILTMLRKEKVFSISY